MNRFKRGKSGYGPDDVVVDLKYELVIWLKPLIINQQTGFWEFLVC